MMKRIAFAVLGGVAASALAWLLLLGSSQLLLIADIRLYGSEAEQQRNFNLFLLTWLGLAVVGIWLGWRRGRRKS
jgi:hypothetical protein